jgi:replication-associated recombination protein RarA
MANAAQPWVEKYRPAVMKDVVLEPSNAGILRTIIETGRFPHLLFHGPPGTGKTTTAINLIGEMQARSGTGGRECLIHLNASDERGVDVVRQQIARFVGAKALFKTGRKFVVLDEVDYMTKCAQQALRHLVQDCVGASVCFCLICNYVTRIDPSLKGEFVRMRFDRLPADGVAQLLRRIVDEEHMDVTDAQLSAVHASHGSDVRSMINHLQSHQDAPELVGVVTIEFWDHIRSQLAQAPPEAAWLAGRAKRAGMSVAQFAKALVNHLVRRGDPATGPDLLDFARQLVDHHDADGLALADFCGQELHAVLSPQRSAR